LDTSVSPPPKGSWTLKATDKTIDLPFYLGCPVWNCADWSGQVYPPRTKRPDWLAWYSRTFNTVEGNSTFYGLPDVSIARRWADQTAEGFRFALKFPREISHVRRLQGSADELEKFLRLLFVLAEADRLGPSFLQLPPDFGPSEFGSLEKFVTSLPSSLPWAVEVRHPDWFDGGQAEGRLDRLLGELRIDKVLFDSRTLFQSAPADDQERIAQQRKPRTPHRETVTGHHPMVRFVGRNCILPEDAALDRWAECIAGWITSGLRPFVFTHTPSDSFAPALARALADKLSRHLPTVPPIPFPPQPPRQTELF
jgi:uncharacterized protein YecE (DUF72 family)